MAGPHSTLTDAINGIHLPQGFAAAAKETVLIKDANGVLRYLSLSTVGNQGPQGEAGTTIPSQSVANIDDPSAELILLSGNVEGDRLNVFEIVANGPNPTNEYSWVLSGSGFNNPPFEVKGDGGVWVASRSPFFQGKCGMDQVDEGDFHGNNHHVHREGRWYGLHANASHQFKTKVGATSSALSGTEVNFHENTDDTIKTKTLSSNTTLSFVGLQHDEWRYLEISSAAAETLTFPSYAKTFGTYNVSGTINYISVFCNDPGTDSNGTITVTNNAVDAGDTIIIAGVNFVFVTDWAVGSDTDETAFNICRAISESNDSAIKGRIGVSVSGSVITITSRGTGTAGDAVTLAKADGATNNFTLSGATLSGGVDGEIQVNINQAHTWSDDDVGRGQSTGLITGGELSINVDTTKFNIADGCGVRVDSYTDPQNPVVTPVTWSGLTAQTADFLLTATASFVGINSSGVVVQQSTLFTSAQRRDIILLGVLTHTTKTTIQATADRPSPITGVANRLEDISDALETIKITRGNSGQFTENATDLEIQRSGATYQRSGLNYENDRSDPDLKVVLDATSVSFIRSRRDGSGGRDIDVGQTDIDPNFFDDGTGTLAAMPAGKFQTQQISFAPAGLNTVIEYGQTTYDSIGEAEAAILDGTHDRDTNLTAGIPIHTWLIVKEGTTDLSVVANRKFVQSDRFGQVPFSNTTTATGNIQQSYENGVAPHLTTNSTLGAPIFREGASVGGSIFEAQDDASANILVAHSTGHVRTAVPTALPADGVLDNGQLVFAVDETNDEIDFKLKKSGGSVITGSLATIGAVTKIAEYRGGTQAGVLDATDETVTLATTEVEDSAFYSITASTITLLQTGRYKITHSTRWIGTSSTAYRDVNTFIEQDTGGGFSELSHSRAVENTRTARPVTSVRSLTFTATANDDIRLRQNVSVQSTGTTSIDPVVLIEFLGT